MLFLPEARCVCRQAAVKAAKILPLDGLARSKQDAINRGHGAQYLYRPPPAEAGQYTVLMPVKAMVAVCCAIASSDTEPLTPSK